MHGCSSAPEPYLADESGPYYPGAHSRRVSKKREQHWTKKHTDGTHEICCIPFAVYDLALGDLVSVDGNDVLVEVVQRSGNWTIRVWFGNVDLDLREEQKREVIDKVRQEMGCLVEWYSEYLLAINANSDQAAKDIAKYLKNKKLDKLVYETGWV